MRKRNQDPNEKAHDMHVYPVCQTRLNDKFLAIYVRIYHFFLFFFFLKKKIHTHATHTHIKVGIELKTSYIKKSLNMSIYSSAPE